MNLQPFVFSAFSELNECRADPHAYSRKLSQLLASYAGNVLSLPSGAAIRTLEGVPALQDCITFLQQTAPVPPLRLSKPLCYAAQELCDANREKESTGPNVDPSQSMDARISNYGLWKGVIGLNFLEGVGNGAEMVIMMLINDGIPSRGHRENALWGRFMAVGVGQATHPKKKFIGVVNFVEDFDEDIITPPIRISAALPSPTQAKKSGVKAAGKSGAKAAGKPGAKKAGPGAGRKLH